jgi:hypothetical protein
MRDGATAITQVNHHSRGCMADWTAQACAGKIRPSAIVNRFLYIIRNDVAA